MADDKPFDQDAGVVLPFHRKPKDSPSAYTENERLMRPLALELHIRTTVTRAREQLTMDTGNSPEIKAWAAVAVLTNALPRYFRLGGT